MFRNKSMFNISRVETCLTIEKFDDTLGKDVNQCVNTCLPMLITFYLEINQYTHLYLLPVSRYLMFPYWLLAFVYTRVIKRLVN